MRESILLLLLTLFSTAVYGSCTESISGLKTIEEAINNKQYNCTQTEKKAYPEICEKNYNDLKAYYKEQLGKVLIYEGIAKIKEQTAQKFEDFTRIKSGEASQIKGALDEVKDSIKSARFAKEILESKNGIEFLEQEESIYTYCESTSTRNQSNFCLYFKDSNDEQTALISEELQNLKAQGLLKTDKDKVLEKYAADINFNGLAPSTLLEKIENSKLATELKDKKLSKKAFENFNKEFDDLLIINLDLKVKDTTISMGATHSRYKEMKNLINRLTEISGEEARDRKQQNIINDYKKKLKELYNSRSALYKDNLNSTYEEMNDQLGDICNSSMLAGDCLAKLEKETFDADEKEAADRAKATLQDLTQTYQILKGNPELKHYCFESGVDQKECDIPHDEAMKLRQRAYLNAKQAETFIKKIQNDKKVQTLEDIKSLVVYNLNQASCLEGSRGIVVGSNCKNKGNLFSSEVVYTIKGTAEILTALHTELNPDSIKAKETATISACTNLASELGDPTLATICLPVGFKRSEPKVINDNFDNVNEERNERLEIQRQYRSQMTARAVLGTGMGTWMKLQQESASTDSFIIQQKQAHFYNSPEYKNMMYQQMWAQRMMLPQTPGYNTWGMNNLNPTGIFAYDNSQVLPVDNSINNNYTYTPGDFINPIPTATEYGN